MRKIAPVLSIVLVMAAAGCVQVGGPFQGLFGPSTPAVEKTPDLLITQNLNVIPYPPVQTGNEFTVSFELKNQDDNERVENIEMVLYDWGVCSDSPVTEIKDWSRSGDTYAFKKDNFDLVPQQTELIEIKLKAPGAQQIGYIETDCPVKWYINYDFWSRSQDDFNVISKERVNELQRTGQTWEGSDQPQYVGIGPVKIYFAFKTPQPVTTGNTIQFGVTVQDKGVGTFTTVSKGSMRIKVPKSWYDADTSVSSCTDFLFETYEGDMAVLKSSEDIPLIRRSSAETICRFKAPDLGVAPEQSYLVSANLTYTYKLTGEQTVHITPVT